MSFTEWLSSLVMSPVDSIISWFNSSASALGDFFGGVLQVVGNGITIFLVESVACIVITYAVYCACRIMCTSDDIKFSRYTNRTLIACVCYFAAKYASVFLLHGIGV